MAYTVETGELGLIDLYIADTAGPGPEFFSGAAAGTYGRLNFPGMVVRGTDLNLGGGAFIFAKAAGAVTPGTVCELTQVVTNGRYDVSAQAWAGAANTGKPICVAVATLASGAWGWFQVQGLAVTTVQGAPVAGNPVYWQASGVISPTAVASKQVLNAQFASAPAVTIGTGSNAVVLGATTALVLLNWPCAQSAIT